MKLSSELYWLCEGAQDERMFAYLFILQQDSVVVLQERVS